MTPQAIIAGAGPAGLVAALALGRAGWEVSVVERTPAGAVEGSGLTLWPNALRALDLLGIGTAVRSLGVACDGIELRAAGGAVLDATPRSVMEAGWGSTGYAFHRAELVGALLELVGPERVEFEVACAGFEQDRDGVSVFLEDGRQLHGELLVGADGIRSSIRERLLGPTTLRYAGFPVWRAVAAVDLGDCPGVTTLGRGCQFGYFPMADRRAYWFASAAAPASSRTGGARRDELLERFGDWHDPIRRLLEGTPEDAIVVSDVYDIMPPARWSDGRVVVIGDAAHASVPHLGQGACQAIEDATVLGACVARAAEPAAALREFERRRVARASRLSRQARRLADMGRHDGRLLCATRDVMLRCTPERLSRRQLRSLFEWDSAVVAEAFDDMPQVSSRRSSAR